ncbi:MAG: Clp protease N-terminal domain-containing protein [Phycisphaerales bacterium]
MARANQEAHRWNHEYIGTEHILLGIAADPSCAGAAMLISRGVEPAQLRATVTKLVRKGPEMVWLLRFPRTPRAKMVIEYAIESTRAAGHDEVSTAHLLAGLAREHDGVAAQVLRGLGVDVDRVRAAAADARDAPSADVPPPAGEEIPRGPFVRALRRLFGFAGRPRSSRLVVTRR